MCFAWPCREYRTQARASAWEKGDEKVHPGPEAKHSATIDYMTSTFPDAELRRLIDDYRASCLWFVREDYYPETSAERERILTLIARHRDHRAFRRVAQLRTWLSRQSSAMSAGS